VKNLLRDIIQAKLQDIEAREQVRILHCIESGSRAWGFASPDSDYDVRFIYIRSPREYLRLDKTRDVIEWQLDDTLDINGWDLQKTLRLLHRSNPTLFEWNTSPIVYRTTGAWASLQPLISACFMQKPALFHYISMASGNYREYLRGDKVKLKKYFYVLRPVLACRWILESKTPPPIAFSELAEACLPEALKGEVERLLKLKMSASEMDWGPRIQPLNEFLEQSLQEIPRCIQHLPDAQKADWVELNEAFLDILTNNTF
jgi:predicted nucleotidyltransferase